MARSIGACARIGDRQCVRTDVDELIPALQSLIILTDIRPGRATDSPQVQAALALLQAFRSSPMAGLVDLKQVAVDVPGALIVTTAQGNEVAFGLQDFPGQLRRWRLVHDHAQRFSKHVVSLDLAVANHSPLIWTDIAGMTPPPPPKPVRASPYKKKHV